MRWTCFYVASGERLVPPLLSSQDAVLLLLETISACLSALNGDDESLRATVALRLAIVQADFRGDRRKACQVCVLLTSVT